MPNQSGGGEVAPFEEFAQLTGASREAPSHIATAANLRELHQLERRILEEIRLEDSTDSEKPSLSTIESDLRKIKINKVPIEQKPDFKLKNMVGDQLMKDDRDSTSMTLTSGT